MANENIITVKHQNNRHDNAFILKTDMLTLTPQLQLKIPRGFRAEIHIKDAPVKTMYNNRSHNIAPRIDRFVGRGLVGRDFYALLISEYPITSINWGCGMNKRAFSDGMEYAIGAYGDVDFTIEEHNRFVASFPEGTNCITGSDVRAAVTVALRKIIDEILMSVFDDIGDVEIAKTDFIISELQLRLDEYFVGEGAQVIPGVRINDISVWTVNVNADDLKRLHRALPTLLSNERNYRKKKTERFRIFKKKLKDKGEQSEKPEQNGGES